MTSTTFMKTWVLVKQPRAEEIHLTNAGCGWINLALINGGYVSIAMGGPKADLEAEAAAMDRLAKVATEAAARLRAGIRSRATQEGDEAQ